MNKLFQGALVLSAFLAGCTVVLRPDNTAVSSYRTEHSVERTYRNIIAVMRECYTYGVSIDTNYFPQANEAEVGIKAVQDTSSYEWLRMQIVPDGSGARVNLKRHTRWPEFDRAIPRWIEKDSKFCPHDQRSDPRPPGSETSQQTMPVR